MGLNGEEPVPDRLPLPRLLEDVISSSRAALKVLTDPSLFDATGVRVAFTDRRGGNSVLPYDFLNLSDSVGDDPSIVCSNRMLLLDVLGSGAWKDSLVVPKQVHGDTIVHIKNTEIPFRKLEAGADGVICSIAEIPVLLCFADCVSLVMVAPDMTFAVAHAGWRGVLSGVSGKTLRCLATASSCDPSECNVYIGPHIRSCCFSLDDETKTRFVDEFGAACIDSTTGNVSLAESVVFSLDRAGAERHRIVDANICTSCTVEHFYSYRAENGICGRHGAYACREGRVK